MALLKHPGHANWGFTLDSCSRSKAGSRSSRFSMCSGKKATQPRSEEEAVGTVPSRAGEGRRSRGPATERL